MMEKLIFFFPFKIKMLIVSLIFLSLTVLSISEADVLTNCQLAHTLQNDYGVPSDQLDDWVCLANAESSMNTAAVGPPNWDGSQDYGIFQINSLYWCSGGPVSQHNLCGLPCSALIDNQLSDDVRCAQQILDDQGFTAWTGWRNKCQGQDLSSYLAGC